MYFSVYRIWMRPKCVCWCLTVWQRMERRRHGPAGRLSGCEGPDSGSELFQRVFEHSRQITRLSSRQRRTGGHRFPQLLTPEGKKTETHWWWRTTNHVFQQVKGRCRAAGKLRQLIVKATGWTGWVTLIGGNHTCLWVAVTEKGKCRLRRFRRVSETKMKLMKFCAD